MEQAEGEQEGEQKEEEHDKYEEVGGGVGRKHRPHNYHQYYYNIVCYTML